MGAAHERRLDGAVNPGALGIGETVEVRTRMGQIVARGDVCAMTPFGVTLREDGVNHRFFAADYFLFFPEAAEVPVVAANMLTDAHPDVRVRARLGDVVEQDASDPEEPEEEPEEATPKADKAAKAKEQAAKADGAGSDPAPVDVDKLPDDIKQAVVVVNKLDGDQVNYILAQVGQALMSALRRNGVNEAELHGLVQKSQNAVYRILTGKSAREWKKAAGE